MLAARFYSTQEPLKIENVPDPQVAPGEVLLAVQAAGLCGTDLHIALEGTIPTAYQPITLGHEAAGIVAQVGKLPSGALATVLSCSPTSRAANVTLARADAKHCA